MYIYLLSGTSHFTERLGTTLFCISASSTTATLSNFNSISWQKKSFCEIPRFPSPLNTSDTTPTSARIRFVTKEPLLVRYCLGPVFLCQSVTIACAPMGERWDCEQTYALTLIERVQCMPRRVTEFNPIASHQRLSTGVWRCGSCSCEFRTCLRMPQCPLCQPNERVIINIKRA